MELLKQKFGEKNYKKVIDIDNPKLHKFITRYVELCNPDSVFVRTDSPEDAAYIRERSKEEFVLHQLLR